VRYFVDIASGDLETAIARLAAADIVRIGGGGEPTRPHVTVVLDANSEAEARSKVEHALGDQQADLRIWSA
jgi:hypothetical protein